MIVFLNTQFVYLISNSLKQLIKSNWAIDYRLIGIRNKSMIHRNILLMTIYMTVGLMCYSYAAEKQVIEKPNFVFFIADDVSQVDFGR